ncbi:hypothetical protein OS242_05215 [Tumebacillus sp. DT12]|uniref:Uncharacterized protein n=1 Tax=Tumebacillus lacus TaxID=2995335 RepID=A0ABT3X019_9BACL|nr:hypothetical protein [Tumebacillus lacus]MCX7569352.1 hypothetical protein [Tumebacillus lacus]
MNGRIALGLSVLLNIGLGVLLTMVIREEADINTQERQQYQAAVYFLDAGLSELEGRHAEGADRMNRLKEADRHLLVALENFKAVAPLLSERKIDDGSVLNLVGDAERVTNKVLSDLIYNKPQDPKDEQVLAEVADRLGKAVELLPRQELPEQKQAEAVNQALRGE